jgi:succinoglycan biosynthesis protein ExoA
VDVFFRSVLSQECQDLSLEIIVSDGLSEDGTAQRLQNWAKTDARIKVISNPGRIVSTGLNAALREARGTYVVRMDMHTRYAVDYIKQCVKALKTTRATCVGGPWIAEGTTAVQRAIATAFQTRLGSGGAASRRSNYSGPIDTVYLGAWRRLELLRLGGFDETLVRNQDDELNLRIHRSGGTVWQSSDIKCSYRPRSSFADVFRQFYQYGYWKLAVLKKHRLPASARHLVPFLFLACLAISAALSPFVMAAAYSLALLVGAYVLVACTAAINAQCGKGSIGWAPLVAVALACMHFGYGLGFAHGLFDLLVRKKFVQTHMVRLTR